MTDVTADQGQEPAGLSAADEQLLRELTERARAGGLKLTGEGGLLGKRTPPGCNARSPSPLRRSRSLPWTRSRNRVTR
jgi:hypothetical protein